MIRSTMSLLTIAAMFFATVGCDEAQYDAAVDDYNEEVVETQETANDAAADGILETDEVEDVQEERLETQEAALDVNEQANDLIESKTD